VPITAKEVNEAAGSAEAKVAREKTEAREKAAARGATVSRKDTGPKRYRERPGQASPVKSVADEARRRRDGARKPAGVPKVRTRGGAPTSPSERSSAKTWSRAGERNQRERASRR
jgi:hypothetical protein